MEYFELLGSTLEFTPSEDTFPAKEGYVIDERAAAGGEGKQGGEGAGWDGRGAVSVVGKGRFKATKAGKSWDESFIWKLSEFDEEGRVGHWEIWADPLSAWVAVGE